MTWVVSFGKYEGGQVWIEQKNGRLAPPNLPDSPLRGEYHSTYRRWLSIIRILASMHHSGARVLLTCGTIRPLDILVLVMLAFMHEPSCPRRQESSFLVLRIAP
eukprot:789719-Amphidinium_carterae.1